MEPELYWLPDHEKTDSFETLILEDYRRQEEKEDRGYGCSRWHSPI